VAFRLSQSPNTKTKSIDLHLETCSHTSQSNSAIAQRNNHSVLSYKVTLGTTINTTTQSTNVNLDLKRSEQWACSITLRNYHTRARSTRIVRTVTTTVLTTQNIKLIQCIHGKFGNILIGKLVNVINCSALENYLTDLDEPCWMLLVSLAFLVLLAEKILGPQASMNLQLFSHRLQRRWLHKQYLERQA